MHIISPYSSGLKLAVAAPSSASTGVIMSQGVHAKIESWQLDAPSEMTDIGTELSTKTWLRGAMFPVYWYDHELSPGVFNKTKMQAHYDFCASRGKMCTFLITFTRKFEVDLFSQGNPPLPADLLTTSGTYSDGSTKYTKMWAFQGRDADQGGIFVTKGYNANLLDATLRTRMLAFLQYVADNFDGLPYFAGVMIPESASGTPLDGYVGGNSSDAHFAGLLQLIIGAKQKFKKSQFIADINATTAFINDFFAVPGGHALTHRFPWSSSNMFTVATGNVALVQSKTPSLNGKIWIMSQIQRHDFDSLDGSIPGTVAPTKEYLYLRARNTHEATHLYVQRTVPSVAPFHWDGFVSYMDGSPYASDPYGGLKTTLPDIII